MNVLLTLQKLFLESYSPEGKQSLLNIWLPIDVWVLFLVANSFQQNKYEIMLAYTQGLDNIFRRPVKQTDFFATEILYGAKWVVQEC